MVLRNVPLMLLDGFGTQRLAPAWVVVRERLGGSEVLRVSAGRDPGAGERLHVAMREEANEMDRDAFAARWSERRWSERQ